MTRRVLTYGYRGVRVGEADHPGPSRRLRRCRERSEDSRHVAPRVTGTISADDEPVVQSCVQDRSRDVRATRRRLRRARALPWSWDSDTESDMDAPSCDGAVCSNVPPELLDAMERDLTTEVPRRSVNNPGPPHLIPHRLASSSDDEPLVRPIIGRDVFPRTGTGSDSSHNRFAALADVETVPALPRELVEAGGRDSRK